MEMEMDEWNIEYYYIYIPMLCMDEWDLGRRTHIGGVIMEEIEQTHKWGVHLLNSTILLLFSGTRIL
jgi:hypothetical protein